MGVPQRGNAERDVVSPTIAQKAVGARVSFGNPNPAIVNAVQFIGAEDFQETDLRNSQIKIYDHLVRLVGALPCRGCLLSLD